MALELEKDFLLHALIVSLHHQMHMTLNLILKLVNLEQIDILEKIMYILSELGESIMKRFIFQEVLDLTQIKINLIQVNTLTNINVSDKTQLKILYMGE